MRFEVLMLSELGFGLDLDLVRSDRIVIRT